ncbi:MAG: DUF4115 domain-containing protein [Truepera sp.]|nr:DUF4115 domain-containing protein [Truepera sp.]
MSELHPSSDSRSHSLGDLLRSARDRQGLDLTDIAGATNVRREYLAALEEGRYDELPGEIYARNFLRLYAKAVNEDPQRLLEVYVFERDRGNMMSLIEGQKEVAKQRRGGGGGSPRTRSRLGLWFSSILLIIAVVLLALWGFNSLLFSTPQDTGVVETGPIEGDTTVEGDTVEPEPVGPTTAFLTIVTDPPGAVVSIDAFTLAGVTPIENAPVTALDSRLLQISLEGFKTYEERLDLTTSQRLEIALDPLDSDTEEPSALDPLDSDTEEPTVTSSGGTIVVTITETTWLEVYQSEARNEGERLIYDTVEPGERYEFDLPIYIHAGNGVGVQLSINDQDAGTLGDPGEVLGRAFP